MARLATIFGGSGFVGRYVARRMARLGWRVRVAVRHPNEAIFVRPYGAVGQVEPVACNLNHEGSVAAALAGADAAVNCVGTFDASGSNGFDAVHVSGSERVASLAREAGATILVHISAIGADAAAPDLYARSKARGEAAVQQHFPEAVILRPSVIFGPEDGFFNRFAAMAMWGPVLPLVGGSTRFQPVYVDDVACAIERSIEGPAKPGIYEIGGPEIESFRELMRRMLRMIRRRRLLVDIPFPLAALLARALTVPEAATFGALRNRTLTVDQVISLRRDNVVGQGAMTLADLGIVPVAIDTVLPDYLWRFRPSGEFASGNENVAVDPHSR